MSATTRHRLLLRAFPRAWRERYGDELDALIARADAGRGVRIRTALDVVRAGLGERLRTAGLTGDHLPGAQRARARLLLVLCAWALFVVAGVSVQKASEHWQRAATMSSRRLPADAFRALEIAAAIGSALVLIGVALAIPRLVARVRAGETTALRRPILRALSVSLITLAAATPVVVWAHRLSAVQRNGHDTAYEVAAGCCALLAVLSLGAWTAAAVAAATQTPLAGRLLRAELAIAAAITATMVSMAVATVVWWLDLASAAPGFVGGGPGLGSSLLVPRFLVPTLLMFVASGLAGLGTVGAIRAAPPHDA
jgi:hypothetical protein